MEKYTTNIYAMRDGEPNAMIDVDVYLASDVDALLKEVAALYCPQAYGFEGLETFPDCGKCVVCRARAAVNGSSATGGQ